MVSRGSGAQRADAEAALKVALWKIHGHIPEVDGSDGCFLGNSCRTAGDFGDSNKLKSVNHDPLELGETHSICSGLNYFFRAQNDQPPILEESKDMA